MVNGRALHWVFKIGDRAKNVTFFREILGMKVLRHEEFDEGCLATCNGPYDGKWSKTMIGYGSEDDHFVVELTYNYGIDNYPLGNDFLGFYIQSSEALKRARDAGLAIKQEGDTFGVKSPDGYQFYLIDKPQPQNKDPVIKVAMASSNLDKSLKFWKDLAGLKVHEKGDGWVSVGFEPEQAKLVLKDIGGPVDHAKAFGRIAFSCPSAEQKPLEALMKKNGQTIITPYIALDTPGKETVTVVILGDPDGHEVCFVTDEGFRKLSEYDPTSNDVLNEAIKKDKSGEWFAKKGGKEAA